MDQFQHISDGLYPQLKGLLEGKIGSALQPGEDLIPAAAPYLYPDDLLAAIDTLLGGWLTAGKTARQFEKTVASYLSCRYGNLVNSGSSANLTAFGSLFSPQLGKKALQKGDEVITASVGFPTTVNPIIQNGCVPVFLDVEIPGYNINVNQLEQAISPKTKAIMLAHTLGNPFNLQVVTEVAQKHNLWLIEDNCDALGATYDGRPTGSFGHLSTLSFFPAHQITTGEGGMVLINEPKLKRVVECMTNWGRDCWCEPGKENTCGVRFDQQFGNLPHGYDHKYTYSHIGYNFKATEMQAAIGLQQFSHLDEFIEKRRKNHEMLYRLMKPLEEFFILPEATTGSEPSWFGFLMTLRNGAFTRNELIQYMERHLIGTRLLFSGNITKQPAYQNVKYRTVGDLPNADKVMNDTLWMGVWPGLQQVHLQYMHQTLVNFLKEKGLV